MFRELTMEEQFETEGGALPLIVKLGILLVEVIFAAGALKGCTDEAAKDVES